MKRSPFVVTREAESDLFEIWEYIADDSVNRADEVISRIREAFLQLATNPSIGHRRPSLAGPHHRFWTVYSYVVVYLWQQDPIQIVAVIHGARNLETFLASRIDPE